MSLLSVIRSLTILLLVLSMCPGLHANPRQSEGRTLRPKIDPYTNGQPELMAAAGVRRFGPFTFGDGRTTELVTQAAEGAPILWMETGHFQIGCSLEAIPLSKETERKKRLLGELKLLAEHLPKVPRHPKELDPWLLLHLTGARLEGLYREFVTRLGLTDFAAQHPFLGTGGPICVLLTENNSTLSRYTADANGSPSHGSARCYFQKPNEQLFFGLALEALGPVAREDRDLRFAMVHNVARVLGDAVRGYRGPLPDWFSLGLGHWFARELVSQEVLLYTTPLGAEGRGKKDANFAVKVRRRVLNQFYPTLEEMETWTDSDQLSFPNHMMAWSRVDFLLRSDGGKRANAFLWAASEPLEWGLVDREEQQARLRRVALASLAGGDLDRLDQIWAKWVTDEYPKH